MHGALWSHKLVAFLQHSEGAKVRRQLLCPWLRIAVCRSMYEKKNRLKGYTLLKQGARLHHKYNPLPVTATKHVVGAHWCPACCSDARWHN